MSAQRKFDLSLYLVADATQCGARGLVATVKTALKGPVSMLQLRGQRTHLRQLLEDALALCEMARHHRIPFVINDHVDIALAAKADGVHVGQADMPVPVARRLLGNDKIIGLSVTCATELASIDPATVDYVGLGPVFPTSTKVDAAPALGIEGFRDLRQQIDQPVVAIGGLNQTNADAVVRAGADGVAVVSAICTALDPEQAARHLRHLVTEAQK